MLVGIVGRPSSGKSTFFKAATLMDVLIASYPFATIKANHGIGNVKIPDLAQEFDKVSEPREGYIKGKWRFVGFELMDVAGLVEGASEGKGLGNEFLNDLAGADAFIHIVDMSGETDGEGKPTEDYDICLDIKIIENELDKWYFGIFEKAWGKFARQVKVEGKDFADAVATQFSGLKVNEDDVKEAIRKTELDIEKASSWSAEDLAKFARVLRKVTKPMIIAANKVDRPNGRKNYEKVEKEFDYPIVPCFSEGELALREADKAELIDYVPGSDSFEEKEGLNDKQRVALEEVGKVMKKFGSTGVQDVLNKVVLEILNLIAVYPAGDKLVDSEGRVLPDCYLLKNGSTALDFAERIHSDLAKNFIKAIDVRTKKPVGKDYKLKHMDGLEIVTK
jgi:ribosome-binding ATPase YchF (GTP1/OBG family)